MGLSTIGTPENQEDESETGILSEINITPLVDVFLVLLIIFMVTSSVMSQMGVDVDLPAASENVAGTQPEGVIVTLLPEGALKVNGVAVPGGDWKAFSERLKGAFAEAKGNLVVLEGDRKAFLGSVIEVMDRARKAGAGKFAIATEVE